MKRRNKRNTGSSTIEYTALLTLFLAAMIILQPYIWRSFMGRWKAAGDTFGQGRQFDPRRYGVFGEEGGTLECFYDTRLEAWVDARCFEVNCDCTIPKELTADYGRWCLDCLSDCSQFNPLHAACGVEGPG